MGGNRGFLSCSLTLTSAKACVLLAWVLSARNEPSDPQRAAYKPLSIATRIASSSPGPPLSPSPTPPPYTSVQGILPFSLSCVKGQTPGGSHESPPYSKQLEHPHSSPREGQEATGWALAERQ